MLSSELRSMTATSHAHFQGVRDFQSPQPRTQRAAFTRRIENALNGRHRLIRSRSAADVAQAVED